MLPAAERHFERSEEACAVDDCAAGFHRRCNLEGTLLVSGEYAAGQTEDGVVRDLDGLFVGIKADDGDDRSEDFHILGDIRGLWNIRDDGRLIVCAVSLAAEQKLAALLQCQLHFLFYLDGSFFADQAADLRILFLRIADLELFDTVDDLLCKFVFQRIVNQETLACAAYLTGIVHTTPYHFFHSQIHIAVVQYDERVIAAELQRGVSQIGGCQLRGADTDFCAAGQSNQMYARVSDCCVFHSARCGQALDDTVRNTGFNQHFSQLHQSQRVVGGREYNCRVAHHQSRRDFLIV